MRYSRLVAWFAASLLAVIVPALLLTVPLPPIPIISTGNIWFCLLPAAIMAMLGYAVLIGLPTALGFYYLRWTRPLAAVAGGLALGALPAAVFAWPLLGLLGAAAGAVFWGTLKMCRVLEAGGSSDRPLASVALAGFAIFLTVLSLWASPVCPVMD